MPPYLMHPHSQALLAACASSGTTLGKMLFRWPQNVRMTSRRKNVRNVMFFAIFTDKERKKS